MSARPAIASVRAGGDAYAIGHGHGAARRQALQEFFADSLCRLNRLLPEPVTLAGLRPAIAAHSEAIADQAPQLARELEGLADGAGLTVEQATLLQLRREVAGYRKVPAAGDCTTYALGAARGGGAPVLAQTVDLNGDLDDYACVLRADHRATGRSTLVLSFAGLLGYLGVNSDGLAVGINLVVGGQWGPGLPPYLAVRHLLDTAASVDEALKVLGDLRLSSSRCLTLCDARSCAYAEVLDGEVRAVHGEQAVHTNHFLHDDLAPRDELNVFARNSSERRLEACRRGLGELPAAAGPEDHLALLSAPPICVEGTGDIRDDRTVAAVVAYPASGELFVRPGNPARARTERFGLRP